MRAMRFFESAHARLPLRFGPNSLVFSLFSLKKFEKEFRFDDWFAAVTLRPSPAAAIAVPVSVTGFD